MLGIIPAAGKGTRVGDFCEHYPKVLFPYVGEPILFWNINWLIASGCNKIAIVVNYKKELIEKMLVIYAAKYPDNYWETDIYTVEQEELNGTAYSIAVVLKDIRISNPYDKVLMVFGDLIAERALEHSDMWLNFVSVEEVDDYKRWVMVDIENDNDVKAFITKPQERPLTRMSWSGIFYVAHASYLTEAIEIAERLHKEPLKETCISEALAHIAFKAKVIPIINFGTYEDCVNSVGTTGIDNAQKIVYNLIREGDEL